MSEVGVVGKQMLANFEAVGGSNVSFVELLKGMPRGDYIMNLPTRENTILWSGMTEDAIIAFSDLMSRQYFALAPAGTLTYMADGGLLDLPVAKSAREYKKPHWLPVVLNKGPGYPD